MTEASSVLDDTEEKSQDPNFNQDELQPISFARWLQSHHDRNTRRNHQVDVGSFMRPAHQTDAETNVLATRHAKECRVGQRKTGTDQLEFIPG